MEICELIEFSRRAKGVEVDEITYLRGSAKKSEKDGMAIESRNSGALDNFCIKTMRNGGPKRLIDARKNKQVINP